MEIILKRYNPRAKKTYHLNINLFIIYLPRTVTVEPATCSSVNTDIVLILQKNEKRICQHLLNLEEIKFLKLMVKHNVCRSK